MDIRVRNLIIWSSIFAFTFLLSLILFLARPGRTHTYVLFFPSEVSNEWIGEARSIYHTRDTEEAVRAMLKELALGPIGLRLEPVMPKGTGVRSVLLRDKTLYIDFTAHLAVLHQTLKLPFPEMLEGIRKSVFINFPSVKEILIYVEGALTDQFQET